MNNMEISQISNDDQSQSLQFQLPSIVLFPFPTVYFVCSAIDWRVIGIICVLSGLGMIIMITLYNLSLIFSLRAQPLPLLRDIKPNVPIMS